MRSYLSRHVMDPSVYIGVVALIILSEGLQNLLGLL